jgi:hypothetical protein
MKKHVWFILHPSSFILPTGTKVLAAAYLALNQRREGSSPSGPTDDWLFDNPANASGTHDVVAAYLLAMQGARVRFPLGAVGRKGVWNFSSEFQTPFRPDSPSGEAWFIAPASGAGDHRFKSCLGDLEVRGQGSGVRGQKSGSRRSRLLTPDS